MTHHHFHTDRLRRLALLTSLIVGTAHGALRHVPEDYPTIGLALAVAVAGDSVLIQPGFYPESGLALPGGVALIGLGEPGSAILSGDDAHRLLVIGNAGAGTRVQGLRLQHGHATTGGALRVGAGSAWIESCVFDDNEATQAGGALSLEGAGASEIHFCTFADNRSPGGSALSVAADQSPLIANTLFSLNSGGPVIAVELNRLPAFMNCDIADNSPGDWTGFLAGFLGALGNLDESPGFCQPGGGDWRLVASSLCLPEHNPDGEAIGALGVGCEASGLLASFTVDATSGGAPLLVTFTDQSTGGPQSWEWDFLGDGNWQAGGPVASHVYEQAGVYWPRLRVSQGDIVSETATDIEIEVLFDVDFQADVTSGRVPLAVHFEALPVGVPDSYEWSFGDGQTQTTSAASVDHVYLTTGFFDVHVVARNAFNEDHRQRWNYIRGTADTLRVPEDAPTLQDICALMDVGTVLILPPGNHWTPNLGFTLPAGAQIIGQPGASPVVVRMTPSAGTLFNVETGEGQLLKGLTFTLSNGQNALRVVGQSSTTLEDCVFADITPNGNTRALQAFDSSRVWMRRCTSTDLGGVIQAVDQSQIWVENGDFDTNIGWIFSCTDDASLAMTGCRFRAGVPGMGHSSGRRLDLLDCAISHSLSSLTLDVDSLLLDHVVLRNNHVLSGALLQLTGGNSAQIRDCAMINNAGELSSCAVFSVAPGVSWSLENCLISGSSNLRVTSATCSPPQDVLCTDIFGNGLGDWTDVLQPFGGQPGNISLDPEICDPDADTLFVTQNSPCVPEHNSCGVAIGGLAAGCTVTAVTADFSASLDQGVAPLSVAFTDHSSGPVESWWWDFESDGVWDSQEQNPVHIFTEHGRWDVSLRVANSDFADTLRIENMIYSRVPRVLRVPEDHATIAAALDAAEFADTVEVACGVYHEHDLALPDWITLRSATGDPTCVTLDAQGQGRLLTGSGLTHGVRVEGLTLTGGVKLGSGADGLGGAVFVISSNAQFSRCILRDNQAHFGGAGSASIRDSLVLDRCVLDGNSSLGSGAAWLFTGAPARLEHCLVTGNSGGNLFSSAPQIHCSDLFGNSPGNWAGGWADQLGQDGNIEADPLYCDAPSEDFGLQDGSPCLPPASPCGAMGAWEGDCQTGLPDPERPRIFTVGEARPNPFNPSASLTFTLPEAGLVQARLFNVKGQYVGMVLSGQRAAGTHTLLVDGSSLASGVYLLQVKAGPHEAVRKLTLLK